jgi:hypothetical protein
MVIRQNNQPANTIIFSSHSNDGNSYKRYRIVLIDNAAASEACSKITV